MTSDRTVKLSARRLPLQLAAVTGVLCACHVCVMIVHYRVAPLPYLLVAPFDLDEEQGFGTWFSASLLQAAGLLSFLVSRTREGARGPEASWWTLIGLGFVLLSLDEVVGLHETFNTLVDVSWTVPAAVLATGVALVSVAFLRRIPSRTRAHLVIAGLIFLGGALGVERAADWYGPRGQLDTLGYNLTIALEEGMEMGGVILFIHAVLSYIASTPSGKASVEIGIAA